MSRSSTPQVRKWTRELLAGYIQHPSVTTDEVDDYITPSSFGQNAGMVGCLTLAHVAYEEAGGRGAGAGPVMATRTIDSGSRSKGSGCCKGKMVRHLSVLGVALAGVVIAARALKSKK